MTRVTAPTPWTRLATRDIHPITFTDAADDGLLFGHHDGLLRSGDGGITWAPLAFSQDAMETAAATDGSIFVAGHGVLQYSLDEGRNWARVEADLPSLDIHGSAQSSVDPSRMWAYLAEGGAASGIHLVEGGTFVIALAAYGLARQVLLRLL